MLVRLPAHLCFAHLPFTKYQTMIPKRPKNATFVFYGFKIKASDIKRCLTKLTDLSGALHSFSIRVTRNERPRNKLIIDIEMAEGFDPHKYDNNSYLFEFISLMKKVQRDFREFIRSIPAEFFPELYFHSFRCVHFNTSVFCIKSTYYF